MSIFIANEKLNLIQASHGFFDVYMAVIFFIKMFEEIFDSSEVQKMFVNDETQTFLYWSDRCIHKMVFWE